MANLGENTSNKSRVKQGREKTYQVSEEPEERKVSSYSDDEANLDSSVDQSQNFRIPKSKIIDNRLKTNQFSLIDASKKRKRSKSASYSEMCESCSQ